jgi:outer membrane protein assembly factor BamD (BamD/ComL family)
MSANKKEDTQKIKTSSAANKPGSDTQQIKTSGEKILQVKKPKLWRVIVFGILSVILLAVLGGGLGYKSGINDRLNKQNEQMLSEAALQYQYGVQQLNNGNYQLARTHFEYVLQVYPDFPGLTEKYTEVMVKIAQSNEPTATPAATATPDNRDVETLFAQASQEVQSQQWEAAVNSLEALRNADYTYRTMEVDGMYYIALRYRAVQMILNDGNLEEGLYYFSVLEKYAPLDKDAVNYSNVARLYLTGASYWDLDWQQVVNYFSQLVASMPGLYDGTMTASERYYYALIYYGDKLMDDSDECGAEDQYSLALAMTVTDDLQSKYNKAYRICHPPTKTPTEEEEITVEETEEPDVDPEPEVPVETPASDTSGSSTDSGDTTG